MSLFGIAAALFATHASSPQPFDVRFARVTVGQEVTVSIDGGKAERVFAGKMGFQEENRSWQSVCADVRSPIREGQFFQVTALSSAKFGGNIAVAGNIVARWFDAARTPDQCAGLQLAVWKAVEDGTNYADFTSGHLRARASLPVMVFAQEYYLAASGPGGDAVFLQVAASGGGSGAGQGQQGSTGGGGQSQLSTSGGGSSAGS